jgi:hypothetical protein
LASATDRPPRSTTGRSFVYGGRSHLSFVVDGYGWPGGSRYEYLAVGGYLPELYWVPKYFVEDYDYYGVAPPPANFAWVRYGPDLLLINLDTGEIAREILGMFQGVGDASPGGGGMPAYGRQPSSYTDPDELPGDPPAPGEM